MLRILVGSLALVLGSCSSVALLGQAVERPTGGVFEARSGLGRVYLESLDQLVVARSSARAIDECLESTAEWLGFRREREVEIWLVHDWPMRATTHDGCIVFRTAEQGVDGFADLILSHEFVHWHSRGTPMYDNLPPVVMEGVCEWIALKVVPQWAEEERARQARLLDDARGRGGLAELVASLGFGRSQLHALAGTGSAGWEVYALGFALVDRIGVETLREAASAGPVSPSRILKLAGVGPDGQGL